MRMLRRRLGEIERLFQTVIETWIETEIGMEIEM